MISILSGTGYVTDDFGLWGKFSLIFFYFLMFIGGCADIFQLVELRFFRLQMLLIFLKNQIKKLISPNSVIITKYNNQKISDDFINSVIIFIFTFLFIFLIIAMLLSISGLDFITSISGAASSISNVGPGLGDVIGPNGNYKAIPDISKWILSAGMLLGRLELFAVLVLFFPSFWRINLWKFIYNNLYQKLLKFILINTNDKDIISLGAISGFPWVIIGSSLSLWLKEDGLSRSTIGWAGLIFAVYAFNYLWAPIIDRS